MIKKIIAFLLVLIMSVQSFAVFANTGANGALLDAMEKTGEKYAEENNTISANAPYESIMEKLMGDVFRFGFSLDFKLKEDSKITINDTADIDMSGKRLLNSLNVAAENNNDESMDIDVDIYLSDKRLALHIPQLYGDYFFINRDDIGTEKWNNSHVSDLFGGTTPNLDIYDYYIDRLFAADRQYSYEKMSSIVNPYIMSAKKLLSSADTSFEGRRNIATSSTSTEAKVYKSTITAKKANEFLNNMAADIRSDKELRRLLDDIYGSTKISNIFAVYGFNETMTDLIINVYAETLESFEITDNIIYTAYVDGNGLIVRNEIATAISKETEYDDEIVDAAVSIVFETKGKQNLYDDISLSVMLTESNTQAAVGFDLYLVGTTVPADGIFSGKGALETKTAYSDKPDNGSLFNLSYYLDTNKSEDNFALNMAYYSEYAPEYPSVLIVKGDLELSEEKSIINANLPNTYFKSGYYENDGVIFNLKFNFMPSIGARFDAAENSGIDVIALSEEEIEKIGYEIEDNGQKLMEKADNIFE